MGIAGIAKRFDPLQKRRTVEPISDNLLLEGIGERWPASIGLELLRGIEQDRVAAQAGIDCRLKDAAHFRAEGALRPGLPGDVVFLLSELSAPLAVLFDNPAVGHRVAVLCEIEDI